MVVGRPVHAVDVREDGNIGEVRQHGHLSLAKKKSQFGLECEDNLRWQGWEPGGEYTRQLTIRNVKTSALKLGCKVLRGNAFSMAYPKPIVLMPGMATSIKIKFRPLKVQQYQGEVEIVIGRSSFVVMLAAMPPTLALDIPAQVDFGCCPVHELATRSFIIRNTGEVPCKVSWRSPAPFKIAPECPGVLRPTEVQTFTASFTATGASVVTGIAVCALDTGQVHKVRVTGIGKFPFLQLSEPLIGYDDVMVGTTSKMSTRLQNLGSVPATVTIQHSGGFNDGVFSVSPLKGLVAPGSWLDLSLSYRPESPGTLSSEEFDISTPGGYRLQLRQQGRASSIRARLSESHLDFGDVHLGCRVRKVVSLCNQSSVEAHYACQLTAHGTFSMEPNFGVVKPGLSVQLTITFGPRQASNYWKRAAILLENGDPLHLDLLGSGYGKDLRPASLPVAAVKALFARMRQGGPVLPAAQALETLSEPRLGHQAGAYSVREGAWDLVFGGQDVTCGLYLDPGVLNFSPATVGGPVQARELTVTNRLPFTVIAAVDLPLQASLIEVGPRSCAWQVIPTSHQICTGATVTFQLLFSPSRAGQYSTQEVDLVACAKYMRSFRLCNEDGELPPFAYSFTLVGSSFGAVTEDTSPCIRLSSRALRFPLCRPHEASHGTILVHNDGLTPFQLRVISPDSQTCFLCHPHAAVVPPRGAMVLAFRFCPTSLGTSRGTATLLVNSTSACTNQIVLTGTCCHVQVRLDVGKSMVCKPTPAGSTSTRAFRLLNCGRMPAAYFWSCGAADTAHFRMSPSSGLLRVAQEQIMTCSFSPTGNGRCQAVATCTLCSNVAVDTLAEQAGCIVQDDVELARRCQADDASLIVSQGQHRDLLLIKLELSGRAAAPAIDVRPKVAELGVIAVDAQVLRTFTIANTSDASFQPTLELRKQDGTTSSVPPFDASFREGPELAIEGLRAGIPARSTIEFTLVIRPSIRQHISWTLLFQSQISPQPDQAAHEGAAGQGFAAYLTLEGEACYPTLQICDVVNPCMPRAAAWACFGAAQVNALLAESVSANERWLRNQETHHGMGMKEVMRQLRPNNVHFGTVARGQSTLMRVLFVNPGKLPVHWRLGGSGEPDLELLSWVEPSVPRSAEEAMADFIVDSKLFQYSPEGGCIPPGGHCEVTLIYSGRVVGKHALPVQLLIAGGRRLRLDLIGNCKDQFVEIFLPGSACPGLDGMHKLHPVALGDAAAPKQVVTFWNSGSCAVSWSVDTSALDKLRNDSWGHPVLRLLSPSEGTCGAGCAASLSFLFCPLVSGTMTITLPIHATGASFKVQRMLILECCGYDPSSSPAVGALCLACGRASSPTLKRDGFPWIQESSSLLLSTKSVDFGFTIVGGQRSAVIAISSASDNAVHFEWNCGSLRPSLEVEPSAGSIEPGEHVLCLLTFNAGVETQLVESEVAIEVETCLDRRGVGSHEQSVRWPGLLKAKIGAQGDTIDEAPLACDETIAMHPQPFSTSLHSPREHRSAAHAPTESTDLKEVGRRTHARDLPSQSKGMVGTSDPRMLHDQISASNVRDELVHVRICASVLNEEQMAACPCYQQHSPKAEPPCMAKQWINVFQAKPRKRNNPSALSGLTPAFRTFQASSACVNSSVQSVLGPGQDDEETERQAPAWAAARRILQQILHNHFLNQTICSWVSGGRLHRHEQAREEVAICDCNVAMRRGAPVQAGRSHLEVAMESRAAQAAGPQTKAIPQDTSALQSLAGDLNHRLCKAQDTGQRDDQDILRALQAPAISQFCEFVLLRCVLGVLQAAIECPSEL